MTNPSYGSNIEWMSLLSWPEISLQDGRISN